MNMKKSFIQTTFSIHLCLLLVCLFTLHSKLFAANEISWKKVEAVFGKTGTVTGNVIRIGFPRTDLRVNLGGVAIRPLLALSSWAAFSGSEDSALMMGDLVLLQTEVESVIDHLEAGGVMVTALHNHLIQEIPHVMYLHYMGHGNAEALAKTLKSALATTETPRVTSSSSAPKKDEDLLLEVEAIEKILGKKGTVDGGVLTFGFPRAEVITEHGVEIPPTMGLANSINIQNSPDGIATTGDFVLASSEVNPVLKALRSSGISVTALHNHMLDENPRLFFLHFWGTGPAPKIAAGLKKALDQINLKK